MKSVYIPRRREFESSREKETDIEREARCQIFHGEIVSYLGSPHSLTEEYFDRK